MAGGLALAASTFALIAAPVAGATTYNNDTPIIIPQGGAANPYPSSITVSGTAGAITDVNLGLDGFTHTRPDDVAIALVAPGGQALKIYDCVGDVEDAAGLFLTFDDAAASQPPNAGALATGTFKPASYCAVPTPFPAPGPLTSYGNPGPADGGTATFASTFNGLSAIGTWNLYVFDAAGASGAGSIPGGWSLDVHPDVTPLPPATPTPAKKCKKKKKAKKGASAATPIRALAKRCKKKKRKK